MGSYPWGPHGPQSGPNQVTPNPTPAWVPPPPAASGGSWGVPAPSGGGGGAVNTNYTYTFKRGPKHYWLGLILAAIFGPLGLFYASKKGALLLLVLLFAVPLTLATLGGWHGAFLRHPLNVLGNDRVMDGMWRLCVLGSLVWCVFGVRRYNKQFKEVKQGSPARATRICEVRRTPASRGNS